MLLEGLMTAYAAFAMLAIGMKRYRPAVGDGVGPSSHVSRLGGAMLLILSCLPTLHREGYAQGMVAWLGSISLAAILLVLLMSWRPVAAFMLAVPALMLSGLLVLLK